MFPLLILLIVALAAAAAVGWQLHRRHLTRWLGQCLWQTWRHPTPAAGDEVHVLLCIADHYEPKYQNVPPEVARARVQRWLESYPRLLGQYRDSDGRKPRHTFFYPAEEYEPEYLDALTELCAQGHGEVEIHLHHDNDTAASLREKLVQFRDTLADRHGLLARHRQTGEVAYGFIHGNWALCNCDPRGRNCGVNNEIEILRETGCYADLTFPSAPSPTQPPRINSIYYAVDHPGQPCSHESGVDAGTGPMPADSLLLIQGPLVLDWTRRKWGILPRLENGCMQGSQPPTIDRLPLWLKARVRVPSRPDWYFVKLYCHGTIEDDHEALLGQAKATFHAALAEHARQHPRFHYHYVSARELYNLVKAAEAGWTGSVADALDYELLPGPALAPAEVSQPLTQPQGTTPCNTP